MLEKTGIPTKEDIASVMPSAGRRARGPVAMIECFRKIPCNPCYTNCRRGAIKELIDINDLPELNEELCNGCGVCVSNCPGLAITVIDESYSENEALVTLPYEFRPLPSAGQYVSGLDRAGESVCRAKVVRVVNAKSMDRTPTVTLAVPKELSTVVRFFKTEENLEDNVFLCRCEGITRGEVRELIKRGCTTVDEIKRLSRAGMGPCQGRTCRQLIMNEIAAATGVKQADQLMTTFRPPVKPVSMSLLLEGERHE